jgi:hypothetical protein
MIVQHLHISLHILWSKLNTNGKHSCGETHINRKGKEPTDFGAGTTQLSEEAFQTIVDTSDFVPNVGNFGSAEK